MKVSFLVLTRMVKEGVVTGYNFKEYISFDN